MNTVTITIDSMESVAAYSKQAFKGEAQDARISFASLELLWKVLAPNRMAIVKTLTGSKPLALREIARRVGRDIKSVHNDVKILLNAGVLDRSETGQIIFDYEVVHFNFKV